MVPFQTEPYWEAELKRMLDDQKPEDAHLDYKGTESLLPPGRGGGGLDKQKRAEDGIWPKRSCSGYVPRILP